MENFNGSTIKLKCNCGFIFKVKPTIHFKCPNCGGLEVDDGYWLSLKQFNYNWDCYVSQFRKNHRNRIKRIEHKFKDAVVMIYEKDFSRVLEVQHLIGNRFPTNFFNENEIILANIDRFLLIKVICNNCWAGGYGFFENNKFYYWNAGREEVDDLGNFLHMCVIKEMMRRKIDFINGGTMEIKCKPLFHYEKLEALNN